MVLLTCSFFVSFLFLIVAKVFIFDIESFFDITDVSILQIIFFTVLVAGVIKDLVNKFVYGLNSNNDVLANSYALVAYVVMFFYLYVIWFGFFLHSITVLIEDNAESVMFLLNYTKLYKHHITFCLGYLFFCLVVFEVFIYSKGAQSWVFAKIVVHFLNVTSGAILLYSLVSNYKMRFFLNNDGFLFSKNLYNFGSKTTDVSLIPDTNSWFSLSSKAHMMFFIDTAVLFYTLIVLLLVVFISILSLCIYFISFYEFTSNQQTDASIFFVWARVITRSVCFYFFIIFITSLSVLDYFWLRHLLTYTVYFF